MCLKAGPSRCTRQNCPWMKITTGHDWSLDSLHMLKGPPQMVRKHEDQQMVEKKYFARTHRSGWTVAFTAYVASVFPTASMEPIGLAPRILPSWAVLARQHGCAFREATYACCRLAHSLGESQRSAAPCHLLVSEVWGLVFQRLSC